MRGSTYSPFRGFILVSDALIRGMGTAYLQSKLC